MFVLKTEKAARYFCSFCKSTLILYEDTGERFVAVCPKYHRYNSGIHDNLNLLFPSSTVETCPHCNQEFSPGIDCLDSKNFWRCPLCHQRLPSLPNHGFSTPSGPISPITAEALRVFSGGGSSRTGFYRGTPIFWREDFREDAFPS